MKQDIILIGMPGCGKSALGKRLAKRLGLAFVDLDDALEQYYDRKIDEIFATDGEAVFRDLETETLRREVGRGRVLATGGGVVVREENLPILRRGRVIFLDRPPQETLRNIKTETRPLLKQNKAAWEELYRARYPRYLAWSEIRIENTGSLEEALEKLMGRMEER